MKWKNLKKDLNFYCKQATKRELMVVGDIISIFIKNSTPVEYKLLDDIANNILELSFEGKLKIIYLKSLRLNNIGGFVYIKDLRFIAKTYFNLSKKEFDKLFLEFYYPNYKRFEIGQGISSGLNISDAISIKQGNKTIPVFYIIFNYGRK